MRHKGTLSLVLLLAVIFVLGVSLSVYGANKSTQGLAKVTTDNEEGYFDGNRIYSEMRNNGQIVYAKGGDSGMYWPGRASLKTINYASGVWVAGKVNGVAVTAAAEYESEWAAGKVLDNGEPSDMYDPKYKMYKVNKADELDPEGNDDWMNWPVEDGAPWIDADGDGVYDPLAGDMPDMLGSNQMIWYVMNDLDGPKHDNVFSSQPIGLECQVTIWGYNRPDEFGDMMFAKFQLFNKKNTTVDSCYLGIWADIDLGDASDDFIGCDTTLSLGYSYNDGADQTYGDAAPAIGYDFFQGAIVASPGDTAKGFGTYFPDYKNLGMNTFAKYINNDDEYPDPETAQECWNYMAGLRYDGTAFVHPITGEEMVPVLYAPDDPVAGTGWLDALDHPAGDRRQLQSCGPFTLAPGDSQEIVTACIIAQGTDHLTSITRLKLADQKAQIAYNIDFALPPSPPVPIVNAQGMDGEIILTWDDAAELYMAEDPVDLDDEGNPSYYHFQGYNVYQLETDYGSGVQKRIATYDIADDLIMGIKDFEFVNSLGETVERTVQYGTDSGIQRHMIIDSDVMRGNAPLVNNRPYYFAVTAYGYNPIGVPKALESPIQLITVYPQDPIGRRFNDIDVGDDSTIVVSHEGPSQGRVSVRVIDPSKVKNHDYKVEFYDITTDGDHPETHTVWKLTDTTTGEVVLDEQTHQGDDEQFTVVDGIMVQVSGPPAGLHQVYMTDDDGNLVDDGCSILEFSLGPPGFIFSNRAGDVNLPPTARDFDRFGLWGANDIEFSFSETSVGWQYGNDSLLTERLPFAMYFHNFATGERERMYVAVFDEGWGDATVEAGLGAWDTTGVDDVFGATAYEPIYAYISSIEPYDPAKEDAYIAAQFMYETDGQTGWGGPGNPVGYPIFTAGIYVDYLDAGLPDPTHNIIFETNKPNSSKDVFTFSIPDLAPTETDELAKMDIDKINVFPNPYFGANVEEMQPLEHFIRFTNLPDDGVTLRIYTLAGELVRTLHHDNGTAYEEWNLLNEYDIPVASGMYIVHVDCGDLGEKILKLALVMAEERLRQF